MKTDKDFDAVKMMRDIRDKRCAEYDKYPEFREQRLKKYSAKIKSQETTIH